MDQAIIALLGISITLILYLDRGRRADIAQLRQETHAGFTQLREETQTGLAQLREETRAGFAQITEIVLDLCRRVGRLEGRSEAAADPPS